MINDKAKITTYNRYGVENIRQSEEYVNIIHPDKTSELYQQFNKVMNDKVSLAMSWLSERNIEYVWSNWIDGHLYRLCIPEKDLLLDFEFYPVNNMNYNYIRINYDTNILDVLGRVFPTEVVDTQDMQFYILTPRRTNQFLKENGHSPIYDKHVLRAGLVKGEEIYQCIIVKQNKITVNLTKQNAKVVHGTYMILRYLVESLGFSEILIKDNCNDSYRMSLYELLNLPAISKTAKKKIWWNLDKPKWHINKQESENYMPFYFTEQITYKYPSKEKS